MNRSIKLLTFGFLIHNFLSGQVLFIKEIAQEQSQWCWAAVSKCILDYYNYNIEQCEIAEYTRTVATWHDFGTEDCCITATKGCNYWNYNWGPVGSIQDILQTFGNIQNSVTSGSLTTDKIQYEIKNCRPFIIRWGWTTGGGHFLVGYGINESSIFYLDPWIGEGYKISDYSWLVAGDTHTWTSTNLISTSPSLSKAGKPQGDTVMIQDPENKTYTVTPVERASSYVWSMTPFSAGIIDGDRTTVSVDFDNDFVGHVVLSVKAQYNCMSGEKNSLDIVINPKAPVIILSNNTLCSNYEEGNQWYFNQKIIPNANDQTCKPLKNGEYYCIVTVNSCTSSPSNVISYFSTGLTSREYYDDIRISPNPVTSLLLISINYTFMTDYRIEIFNGSGSLKFTRILDKKIKECSIDFSHYPKGTYILRISDMRTGFQKLIVKN